MKWHPCKLCIALVTRTQACMHEHAQASKCACSLACTCTFVHACAHACRPVCTCTHTNLWHAWTRAWTDARNAGLVCIIEQTIVSAYSVQVIRFEALIYCSFQDHSFMTKTIHGGALSGFCSIHFYLLYWNSVWQ